MTATLIDLNEHQRRYEALRAQVKAEVQPAPLEVHPTGATLVRGSRPLLVVLQRRLARAGYTSRLGASRRPVLVVAAAPAVVQPFLADPLGGGDAA